MNILVITGLLCSETAPSILLEKAGIDLVSNDKQSLDEFSAFYDSLLTANGMDTTGFECAQPLIPSNLWIQKGRDLLRRCGNRKYCGWVDSRTTLLLDFWHKLEPQVKFLLVYQPPWLTLEQLYRQNIEPINKDPELALRLWMHVNLILLKFYHHNRDKCLLVNTAFLDSGLAQLVESMNSTFNYALLPPERNTSPAIQTRNTSEPLYSHILLQTAPESVELYMELESCATLLGREPDFTCQSKLLVTPSKSALLHNWSAYCSKQTSGYQEHLALQQRYEAAKIECEETGSKLKAEEKSLENVQKELEVTQKNLGTATENQVVLNNKILGLTQQFEEGAQESALLLLQLHQVQEELEHYFLLAQNEEARYTKLETEWKETRKDLETAINSTIVANNKIRELMDLIGKIEQKHEQTLLANQAKENRILELERLLTYYQSSLDTAERKIPELYQSGK